MFDQLGVGLIVSAIFARELATRVKGVDYRLLIASAYTGFLFWHAGLSGSIPLAIASGSNIESVTAGALTEAIPVDQTIFSTMNLFIIGAMVIVIPLLTKRCIQLATKWLQLALGYLQKHN